MCRHVPKVPYGSYVPGKITEGLFRKYSAL
jgi:hypothetical protein